MDNGEELFPEEFKKYVGEKLSWSRSLGNFGWIFWSRDAEKLERSPDSPYCNLEFKKKIIHALELIKLPDCVVLIQYWVPTIIDGRCSITTRNQPFFLSEIDEGLCGYRMISKAYNFYVDGKSEEELGLPGRVFLNKLPESTPNVKYYSSKEYPQRDDALRHDVEASLALPVFDAFDQSCVGVLELVTVIGILLLSEELDRVVCAFKEVGLNCSDVHNHSSMLDSNKNEAFTAAKDEITKVLKEMYKVNGLHLALAWVPCSLFNPVVNGIPGVSYSTGQVLSTISSLYYEYTQDVNFLCTCAQSHSRLGQGVVGRAFLSRNMLFCKDVTQFSMSEYPLAHYARQNDISGCFAICLQSSHTGNDIYILEFFLHDSNRSDGQLQTLLHNIERTMKQSFKTLKLASGEELGEELPIDVIDFHNGEKRFGQIPPTIRSPPRPTEAC